MYPKIIALISALIVIVIGVTVTDYLLGLDNKNVVFGFHSGVATGTLAYTIYDIIYGVIKK